jgi:gag-polyprotein putative aspartyl protease
METPKFKAFTITYRRIVSVLECYVNLEAIDNVSKKKVLAFFDTGAMISSVSQECARQLQSEEVGSIRIRGFTGSEIVPQHILDVGLPNNIEIKTLIAAESKSLGENQRGEPYGFLIGMDILKHGDLAVNHANGYTTLSFRTPSINHVDYVEEYNQLFPDDSEMPKA